jgi:hypothetical protein
MGRMERPSLLVDCPCNYSPACWNLGVWPCLSDVALAYRMERPNLVFDGPLNCLHACLNLNVGGLTGM